MIRKSLLDEPRTIFITTTVTEDVRGWRVARKMLFGFTMLILAALVASPSFAHTFDLYGSVVGGDASGSYLVLETGSGPGHSRYTVVCAASHAAVCAEMWDRVQQDSPVGASVEGQIIKQVASDNLTQSVRFRATYWLFTISPLPIEGGGLTGRYVSIGSPNRDTVAPTGSGERQ